MTDSSVLTVTDHAPGSILPHHAHTAPHLAILLQGAYFERMGDDVFLRLPGDEVFYAEYSPHENRFGRLPARCLNVEGVDGSFPAFLEAGKQAPGCAKQARELIEAGSVRSLSQLAAELGYHSVYLARAFRSAFGTSVGKQIRVTRIRKAARLIFQGHGGLGEIAVEAGYFDQSHLCNEFANEAGFTPGELRRLADQ